MLPFSIFLAIVTDFVSTPITFLFLFTFIMKNSLGC